MLSINLDDVMNVLSSISTYLIAIAVIAMFAIVGIFDTAANWGKAYGNVSVAGMDVSGKTEEEIATLLQDAYAQRVSHAQVTVFADEEAKRNSKNCAISSHFFAMPIP